MGGSGGGASGGNGFEGEITFDLRSLSEAQSLFSMLMSSEEPSTMTKSSSVFFWLGGGFFGGSGGGSKFSIAISMLPYI